MIRIFIILILLIINKNAYAQNDLSIVGDVVEQNSTNSVISKVNDPVDVVESAASQEQIQGMKNYLDQERKKQNEINLLQKDIEKSELELKKKQIQQQINSTNSSVNSVNLSPVNQSVGIATTENLPTEPTVLFISKTVTYSEALLVVDGVKVLAHEGDKINNNYTLKVINKNSVVLIDTNGQETTLKFNSAG